MKKLEIGKKYTTHSDNKEIDFDYLVLDFKKNKVLVKILSDRTKLPFSNYVGIKCLNYSANSQFLKNSKELL